MTAALQPSLPISPSSLRDEVYAHLRHRILTHVYPPGYRFNLNAMETQFGVSLTPLKEALHRLEVEGLVEIRPRRGTFVTRVDAADVAESFDVRRILECAAAVAVAPRITEAELAELQELDVRMVRLLQAPEYQAIVAEHIELDRQMHTRLVEMADNRRLLAVYQQIDTHLQVARLQDQWQPAQSEETRREHARFLEALATRSADATVAALAAHIDASKDRTLAALRHSLVAAADGEEAVA
jgi:DNA-binding GntR family transcriptional regulator